MDSRIDLERLQLEYSLSPSATELIKSLLARIEGAEKALEPFANISDAFGPNAVLEVCEPHYQNPSPHIVPVPTSIFRAAAQWLQAGRKGEG